MYCCWQRCHFSSCWFYWIGLCDIYIWRSKILLWNKQKMGYCLDLPIIFNVFVKHNIATFIVIFFQFGPIFKIIEWNNCPSTFHVLLVIFMKIGPNWNYFSVLRKPENLCTFILTFKFLIDKVDQNTNFVKLPSVKWLYLVWLLILIIQKSQSTHLVCLSFPGESD